MLMSLSNDKFYLTCHWHLPQILISLSALLLASHSPLGENLTLDTACAKHGSHDIGTIILKKPNLCVASQCELKDIVGLERGGRLGCWGRPTTASTFHFKFLFHSSELTTKDRDFTFHFKGRSLLGVYNLAWSGSMKSSSKAIAVGRLESSYPSEI